MVREFETEAAKCVVVRVRCIRGPCRENGTRERRERKREREREREKRRTLVL